MVAIRKVCARRETNIPPNKNGSAAKRTRPSSRNQYSDRAG